MAGEAAHARQYPVLAAADEDGLAIDQRLGDLGTAALEHAAHGLARDAHGLGSLLVAEGLEVDEANGLELVDGQLELLELTGRYAGRLEERDAGDAFDGAFNRRARHVFLLWLLAYAHDSDVCAHLQTAAAGNSGVSPDSDWP